MEYHVSLKGRNTFGIDVSAAEYGTVTSPAELIHCLEHAQYEPWILGGGSNVLFLDDIKRTVLHNAIGGIAIEEENDTYVRVRVGAGVIWHDLVAWAVDHEYGGIENLALIPGTVGAAPIQNIGAYGVEFRERFVALDAVRLCDRQYERFHLDECAFGYRDSIFKNTRKDTHCIVSVTLELAKPPHQLSVGYGAIRETLDKMQVARPEIRDVFNAVIGIRRSKLPDPAEIGNAGSFFKNPVISRSLCTTLGSTYPGMPFYPAGEDACKVPAGWLIEQCGWKGKRIGKVGCYEKQALVIVNYGNASGREVYDHAMRIQESVASRFHIELIPEVNVMPVPGR